MHAGVGALKCRLVADVARTFGQVRLRVTGSSMLPSLWPGDVLTVRRRAMRELRPGEILLWHREGQLWAHRIIRHHHDHVVTRGDALLHDDAPVWEHEIVGAVVAVMRQRQAVRLPWRRRQRIVSYLLRHCESAALLLLRLGTLRRRLAPEETACSE